MPSLVLDIHRSCQSVLHVVLQQTPDGLPWALKSGDFPHIHFLLKTSIISEVLHFEQQTPTLFPGVLKNGLFSAWTLLVDDIDHTISFTS